MQETEWKEVGRTPYGYTIYRVPNKDIGGFDYVSDSCGNGYIVIRSLTSIEELEVILADMKELRKDIREHNERQTEDSLADSSRED